MEFDIKNMKKGICKLQLNSISDVENDPLLQKATFSILDFEVSGNKQIISKELAIEASNTLIGKPLVCQYNKTTDIDNPDDCFGSHGEQVMIDRYGNEYIGTDTIAIGTALEGGRVETINDDLGNDTDTLTCDFYIWKDRNVPIVQLLNEIYDSGLPLYSSCEYYYKNYTVENGITTILPPLYFSGHCILKSNENDMGKIDPAYDSSKLLSLNEKWNKALSQAIQNNNQSDNSVDIEKNTNTKEEEILENKLYKALCELSYGDIRDDIMAALSKIMTADDFYNVWVSTYAIYDTYFVYENYKDSTYETIKVPYTKTDSEIILDMTNAAPVQREDVWVEVGVVNDMQSSMNDLKSQIDTLTTEKETITTQFNEASEKVISLNSIVGELTPVKKQFDADKLEKAINEKKGYYAPKFKAVNAMDKFESEDIQNLLKLSVNETDEGKDAILQLNTMLVDMVQIKAEDKPFIKEVSSKQENLIPASNDFGSRYSI